MDYVYMCMIVLSLCGSFRAVCLLLQKMMKNEKKAKETEKNEMVDPDVLL